MKIYKAPVPSETAELAPIAPLSITHQQGSSLQTQEESLRISELSLSSTVDVGSPPDQPESVHVLVVDDNDINLKVSQGLLLQSLGRCDCMP